ncbi:hypothetical protein [Tabrizicola sp.]|uniref:hypothetical protein n=1 Tax=Tabrizicola sp. TaxID=2005166 RepID=UPI00261B6724|nr:hypothetical protein [Tabrizicola sp.]MDM7931490.1 hypothetical protein [Tabrizicola sp.]
MKRKTFLTFGAIATVAVIGAASIPAIAGGVQWRIMGAMMGDHGSGMMKHSGMGADHDQMGERGSHSSKAMHGFGEDAAFLHFDVDKDGKRTSAGEISFPAKAMARMVHLTDVNADAPANP